MLPRRGWGRGRGRGVGLVLRFLMADRTGRGRSIDLNSLRGTR
jgi:hypothetical protein